MFRKPEGSSKQSRVADRQSDQAKDSSPRRRLKERFPAHEHVSGFGVIPVVSGLLRTLAHRYDEKTFLPTMPDIRNFAKVYDLEIPASVSRRTAIPRIFGFLKTMDPESLGSLTASRAFSGPAELGPIADAIRNNSRSIRARTRMEGTLDLKSACESCDHWLRNNASAPHGFHSEAAGDCRRYPPVIHGEDGLTKWPQTLPHQHCGEWRSSSGSFENVRPYESNSASMDEPEFFRGLTETIIELLANVMIRSHQDYRELLGEIKQGSHSREYVAGRDFVLERVGKVIPYLRDVK